MFCLLIRFPGLPFSAFLLVLDFRGQPHMLHTLLEFLSSLLFSFLSFSPFVGDFFLLSLRAVVPSYL